MTYFNDFPITFYRFGNNTNTTIFKDLSVYSDVVDQVRDASTTYEKYTIIENLRPDQVSYELYGTPDYYWTFFILNDNIKEQGWPLSNNSLLAKAQKVFPDTVVRTNTYLADSTVFVPGAVIRGTVSGTTATISHRHLDLGQFVVEGTKTFTAGETVIAVDTPTSTLTLKSSSAEYLSARYYTDVEGNIKNLIDSNTGLISDPGAQDTEVTQYDYFVAQNNLLKTINVFRPEVVGQVNSAFREALKS